MRIMLLVIALLGASAARAADGIFYVGAGIARDGLHDVAPNGVSFGNIDSTTWKVLAGLRPVSLFALEAEYLDLGSQTVNPNVEFRAHTSYKGLAGYAVGFLPIPAPSLDVYARVGVAHWSSSGSVFVFANAPPPSLSDHGTEFAWGLGTQVHVGNIGARLEYESFHIPSTHGASIVSLALFLNIF